eukprot:TRINITY_DN986_c0_g1_i1.p2 TRINITY_DN986_c0_g1~~TRINITY_DN986_c0_g1_i1.p2  ORF type:complete len:107 (-),score=25.86 TRINITY_DN986_c0_g1_i1:47-367(-)
MKAIALFVVLAFLGLCFSMPIVEPQGAIECDLCKFIVQEVDDALARNSTQEAIILEIGKTCTLSIFKNHAAVCKSILDYGILETIKFIETNETPDNVCGQHQLNLC